MQNSCNRQLGWLPGATWHPRRCIARACLQIRRVAAALLRQIVCILQRTASSFVFRVYSHLLRALLTQTSPHISCQQGQPESILKVPFGQAKVDTTQLAAHFHMAHAPQTRASRQRSLHHSRAQQLARLLSPGKPSPPHRWPRTGHQTWRGRGRAVGRNLRRTIHSIIPPGPT